MATRADNKDGSCREILTGRLAGKWRVQFIQVDELQRKTRLSRIFPSKTEAKTFLQSLRQGLRIEAAKQKKELTLAGWFDWLAKNDWPEELDEKTIAIRQGRFDRYVRKNLGGLPLDKIDPLAVRTFYRELSASGVGRPTVHAIKANLVRTFNQAINPYRRVSMTLANPFCLTLKASAPRDAVALTPLEASRALASENLNEADKAMLATFLLAGLRLSEQMALTREQLNFGQGLIYIDRAVRLRKDGSQYIGLPKGDKVRTVVMCPTLKHALCAIASDMAPDAFLWPSEAGNKPRMKKSVYGTWKRIVKACELPQGMSPHDCRLTHINWIEKLLPEVSSTTMKEHVGHAAEGVTEVNYTRPLSPAQDLLRTGLQFLLTGSGAPG